MEVIIPDSTPPDISNVTIDDDDGNGVVASGDIVTLSANVSDASAISTVTFDAAAFDAGPVELSGSGNGTYTTDISVGSSPTEGDQKITVSATDEHGNGGSQSVESATALTVDNTPPTIDSTSITDDTDGNGIVADGDSVTITANVTDSNGVSSVTANASGFGAGTVTLADDGPDSTADDDTYSKAISVDGSATQGSQTVTVSATDVADNADSTTTSSLTVDTSAPNLSYTAPTGATVDQPTIEVDLSDTYSSVNESTISVTVADESSTDGADFTQTGTGNGVSYSSGTLTIDLSQAGVTLVYGPVDVNVTADDQAGNGASINKTDVFTVDTRAPSVYNVELSDDGDGLVSDGDTVTVTADVTDDNPITNVTADASAFGAGDVTLVDDGSGADSQANDGTYTGEFQVDGTTATDGSRSVSVNATDVVDNGGTQNKSSNTLTVDTEGPSVENVQIVDTTDENAVVANGDIVTITANVTDANGISSVTADASAFGAAGTVTLADSGPNSTADDDMYSAEISVDGSSTSDGDQSVTVNATDEAENGGSQAAPSNDLTVDTTAPGISVTSPTDGAELASAPSIEGTTTDANDPSTVEVKINDSQGETWDGTAFTSQSSWVTANGTESWAYDTEDITSEGTYDVTVRATDTAGNENVTADPVTAYTLDKSEPSVENVSVTDATDGNGVVANGDIVTITANVTDANTISSVTADASDFGGASSKTLVDNGTGADDTANDGTYTVNVTVDETDAAEGLQLVTVSATDEAGNGGMQANSSNGLTVDTTPPDINDVQLTDTTNGNRVVADGDNVTITANVTDANGISSVTADASAFGAAGTVTLADSGPNSTADDDMYSAEISVDGSSTNDGNQSVTVNATDEARNGGSQDVGSSNELTVDTSAPEISYASPTGITLDQPTIEIDVNETESAINESSIQVTVRDSDTDDGADLTRTGTGSGVSYSSGTLEIDLFTAGVELADGPVNVTMSASDRGDNSDSLDEPDVFTVDTTAPKVENVSVTDAIDGNDVVANGDRVTITANVTDTNDVANVTADASGFGVESVILADSGPNSTATDDTYSAKITVDGLSTTNGSREVTVSATDEAGNGGMQAASSNDLTVDTTAPSVNSVQLTDAINENGVVADDDTVTITANVTDANEIANVTADATAFGVESVTLDDSGPNSTVDDDSYSAEISVDESSTSDGDQSVTVSATDEAGNGGAQDIGSSNDLTVDTGSPVIEYVSPTGETQKQPTITVNLSDTTSEIDESSIDVTVADSTTINGPELEQTGTGEGISYSSGTLTIDLQAASVYLAEGAVDVSVSAQDQAGNNDSISQPDAFIVDTVAPNVGAVEVTDATNGDGVVTANDTLKITAKAADTNTIETVSADASAFGLGTVILEDDGEDPDEDIDGIYTAEVTLDEQIPTDGNQSVTVNATDLAGNGGSQDAESGTLIVDTTAPTAEAGSNVTASLGEEFNLNASDSTDEVGISKYEWDVDGDGSYELNGSVSNHSYDSTDQHTVTLRVTDDAGISDMDTVTVTVEDTTPPDADAGSNRTVEAGNQLILNASNSTDNVGIDTYEWEFGDNGTGNGVSPTYTYNDTGMHTATLTVTDAAGNNATDTVTITVEDTTAPTADAGTNRTVSNGTSVGFNGTASTDIVGITSYEWELGDGTTATGSTPTHTYDSPGTYTATLNVSDDAGNNATDTVTVTVEDVTAPKADAGSNRTVDEDTEVTFNGSNSTDNVGISDYEWDFSDGANATGQTASHTYEQPGTYTVTLNVSDDAGNTATDTVAITVEDVTAPTADAGSNQTVEAGTQLTLNASNSTDNVGIESYEWAFGDGDTGTGVSPTHTYNDTGTYQVTLTVTDDAGNNATDTVTVTVEDTTPPMADAGSNQTVDEDTEITFNGSNSTDNVEVTSYEWSFGDGTTATGTTPTHTYEQPGTYTVTLNVSDDAGNAATDTVTITVEDTTPPTADAGSNQTVDEDTEITFNGSDSTDNVEVTSYEWDFGDKTTATGTTPTHTYEQPGTYTATLKVADDQGNNATDTVTISVEDTTAPSVDAGSNITANLGEEFKLDATNSTDNVDISEYEWDVDDDGTYELNGSKPTHTYDSTGQHTVTLRATDTAENSDIDTVTVTVEDTTSSGSGGGGGGGGGFDPSPTSEVVVDGNDITVTDPSVSERISIEGDRDDDGTEAALSGVDTIQVDRLSMDVETDRDFTLSVTTFETDLTPSVGVDEIDAATQKEVESAANSFESDTNTVSAGYVNVEHDLGPEELSGATFNFRIKQSYLDDLDVSPEDVTLYRRSDGKWNSQDTEYVDSNGTHYAFEGTAPGFSVFALGTSAPKFEVADATLTETNIETDEATTVTATLINRGNVEGEHALALTANGEELASETVTVAGESEETVEFSVDRPAGEWNLALDGNAVDTLVVEEVERGTATDQTTPTGTAMETKTTPPVDAEDGGSLSPLIIVGALLVVVVLVGLLVRRQRTEHDG